MEALKVDRTVLAVAAAFTLLNAAKPLVVDDYAYVTMARHLSAHPFDPLGFVLFWEQVPQPADEHLLTPLVPYVLAPAVLLFGAAPVLWKLWLFPFALGLTAAARALARRVAPGLEGSFVPLLALSPALLPAFNLMLDVPALALHLVAVCLFLAASDRASLRLALLAGLVAGLGAQAKYPALVALPVIALIAVLRRFWLGGVAAVLAGVATLVSWEALLVARYGHSMLASTAGARTSIFASEPWLAGGGLIGLLGGLAPGVLLLALAASGVGMRGLLAAGAVEAAVPFAIALAPRGLIERLWAAGFMAPLLPAEMVVFFPLGLATIVALTRAWRHPPGVPEVARAGERDWPIDTWLLGWLGLEVVAFVAMTPFLAARRALGLITVVSLLSARAAARVGVSPRGVRLALVVSVVSGLVVWGVDSQGARDTRATVAEISRRLQSLGATPAETVWYAGHWSFQYYAEEEGWQPVVPGRSELRAGDWLVRPTRMSRQPVVLPRRAVRMHSEVILTSPFPLTTIPFYYLTPVPYGRLWEAQAPATIGRVIRDVEAGR